MDQPGNGHYAMHVSQRAVNGRNGYYPQPGYDGQAGYEANGHGANRAAGHAANGAAGANGANGSPGYGRNGHPGPTGQAASVGYPQDLSAPAARPAADVAPTGAAAIADNAGRKAPDETSEGQHTAADGTAAGVAASNSAAERMRALLARSTADHAATERATAAALEEIRGRLSGLERAVVDIREHAGKEHDSASLAAEQLSTQAQRLAGMSATLDGLTAGLSTFSAQLSAIDGRLANADTRLAGADVKLASTEGRVTALDTRFERLDERLDDQYDRVTSIDNRLAATDGRLALLGGQFTEALKPLAEDVRARPGRAEIEDIIKRAVEAAHADMSARLASLEDTVLTLAEALLRPAPGHVPPNQ